MPPSADGGFGGCAGLYGLPIWPFKKFITKLVTFGHFKF